MLQKWLKTNPRILGHVCAGPTPAFPSLCSIFSSIFGFYFPSLLHPSRAIGKKKEIANLKLDCCESGMEFAKISWNLIIHGHCPPIPPF